MKNVIKTISWYSFFNVIIAYAFEFLSPLSFGVAKVASNVMSILINVFSYVAIPVMIANVVFAVYFFINVLRNKNQVEAYKYMVMNSVCFVSIAYFVGVNFLNYI